MSDKKNENALFTNTNLTVSTASIVLACVLMIEKNITMALIIIFYVVYCIVFAYICRYIGLKKNIASGYVWGFLLGFIGIIVVGVLPNQNKEQDFINTADTTSSNKYDDLERLQKLKKSGVLTEAEFNSEKQKLLK